jgi:hypothetical protein
MAIAEMASGHPLFPGGNVEEQIALIFKVLGTPSDDDWPDMRKLPGAKVAMPFVSKLACSEWQSYVLQVSDFSRCRRNSQDAIIPQHTATGLAPLLSRLDADGLLLAEVSVESHCCDRLNRPGSDLLCSFDTETS